jgi:hypothetical protein
MLPALPLPGQKAFPTTDGQSGLVGTVPKRHRDLGIVLHHRLADRKAQFVMNGRGLEIGHRVTRRAALEADDLQIQFRQF